jgi:hypothetical protein
MRVRFVSVAALAAVGVLVISGCGRAQPGIAAYVGDTSYSIERVEAVFDDAQTKYAEAVQSAATQSGATPSPEQLRSTLTRQDVVNLLVGLDLGKRVAAANQIQLPDRISTEQVAQAQGMPTNTEYMTLAAEWYDVYQALTEKLPPAELSDASIMAVYQALVEAHAIRPGLSAAEIKQTFGDGAFVRSASAVSAALQTEAKNAGASINPRFRPVSVPAVVGTAQGPLFYALPYIDERGPVTDVSTPGSANPTP